MTNNSLLESMSDWSPEQLLAVHDFCQMVCDTILKHHAGLLLEHLNGTKVASSIDCSSDTAEYNLALPFDDELSF